MGLIEYLENHPEEGLNIHDLTLKPEKKKETPAFDPEQEISNSDWQGMKELLESLRQPEDWGNFSWQAMDMKILAAKEVRISDEGLGVIMPRRKEEFAEPKTPRPERRRF